MTVKRQQNVLSGFSILVHVAKPLFRRVKTTNPYRQHRKHLEETDL
jgi:hypothetical protein